MDIMISFCLVLIVIVTCYINYYNIWFDTNQFVFHIKISVFIDKTTDTAFWDSLIRIYEIYDLSTQNITHNFTYHGNLSNEVLRLVHNDHDHTTYRHTKGWPHMALTHVTWSLAAISLGLSPTFTQILLNVARRIFIRLSWRPDWQNGRLPFIFQ